MDATVKEPGRFSRTLIRLMMKHARVAASEAIGERYRLITLEGPELRGVDWLPGQKIQIAMGSAFVTRTYTPMEWDAAAGRTRILGYIHGPGSAWVGGVQPGDECDIFGPRSSLDLKRMDGPLALYGDETSIGLGYAAIHADASRPVACHFEVEDGAESREVAARLGIAAIFYQCQADDAHLAAMEESLATEAGARFVLSGKAPTIQRLRQGLKRWGVPGGRVAAKAYWAPGKVGLD